jgi:hypothetical protein
MLPRVWPSPRRQARIASTTPPENFMYIRNSTGQHILFAQKKQDDYLTLQTYKKKSLLFNPMQFLLPNTQVMSNFLWTPNPQKVNQIY